VRVVDLTRPVTSMGPVYPGDPKPVFEPLAVHERDGYYHRLACHPEHAGTHLDAPAHFDPHGETVDRIPLTRLVAPGVVYDVRGVETVTPSHLPGGLEAVRGRAVLFYTGWDGGEHPVIDPGLARQLVRAGAALVGVDAPSPDREPWPVHRILLSSGVPIVEYLCCLDRLAGARDFTLVVAPVPYEGGSGAPARVLALLPG